MALACQGGGTHTAFTAGVLKRVLKDELSDQPVCKLVGLSGTSGGAICATLAWYGMVTGGVQEAIRLLDEFWMDNSARQPWDRMLNQWTLSTIQWQSHFGDPAVSPYLNPMSSWSQDKLRRTLEKYIDFDRFPELFEQHCPMLLVGAVDVGSGDFKVFRDEEITVESLLASAALPTVFQAVEMDGHAYWDGLLSQNPPIRDFPETGCYEIWVIQINPQDRHEQAPKSMRDIADRRNELAGNLSLNQEIFFIEKMNEWIREGVIEDERYREINVRRVVLDRDLDRTSKFDRSPSFIKEMIEYGEQKAEQAMQECQQEMMEQMDNPGS